MTITSNTITNSINTLLANTSLANTDLDAAITAAKAFNTTESVISVASSVNLPIASNNTGKMVFVSDESKYYYSDGTNWITDFRPKVITNNKNYYINSWGEGGSGRLGDGTVVDKSSPVSVLGGFTDWCQVSAGYRHTAALRTNGTLWVWGCNVSGALGDGTTVCKSSPISVINCQGEWNKVSAGLGTTNAIFKGPI